MVGLRSQILLSPVYVNLHLQEEDAGIWEFYRKAESLPKLGLSQP